MAKYRKKPVGVEAIQYKMLDDEVHLEQAQDRIADFAGTGIEVLGEDILIPTSSRNIQWVVELGDYVAMDDQDYLSVIPQDEFETVYEAVE